MATKGTVSGVISNMVTLNVDGPVSQNEICYIHTGGDSLMAEVIKVVLFRSKLPLSHHPFGWDDRR